MEPMVTVPQGRPGAGELVAQLDYHLYFNIPITDKYGMRCANALPKYPKYPKMLPIPAEEGRAQ